MMNHATTNCLSASFSSLDQVQKHVQIRMDAYEKYIDSLLATACKIASEQIALSNFSETENELPQLEPFPHLPFC